METALKRSRENVRSMLKVDFRRMFTQRLLYILLGICLVIPVLILVMTTSMGGGETADSAEMFTNVWQIIGTAGAEGSAGMDMLSMCNSNLLYFGAAVLVCLFVTEDFKSGYAKNLFAVRAKRGSYVASKTIVCFVGCALMFLAFFLGAMVGGAVAGLSFELGSVTVVNVVMCLLSKIFLVGVFVAISLLMSVLAKQKTWLALVISFAAGMLLFTMIPTMTPLDATALNAVMCLAGGVLFSLGLGAVANLALQKQDLV